MKTKTIILSVLLILAVCVVWIFLQRQNDGRIAEVYKNGNLVYSCNLDEITESFDYSIDEHNTARFSRTGARMIYADCPDKVCINTGVITGGSFPVVCLPNRVEIRISGGAADAVSQ